VILIAVLVASVSAVGYSYATATGTASAGTAAASGGTPADTPTGTATTNGTATATTTRTPPDSVDVEARFEVARNGGVPSENWSTQRVRRAAAATGGNLTVVATQGFYVSDERAEIAAFLPNGTLVHYDDRYRVYFDVDPVPGERYTVEYVAAKHFRADECSSVATDACTRNVVVRVNLTTGDRRTVYAKMTPRVYSARWHDVDRLNDTHLVVGDIVNDGVYAVDTRDGSIAWRWSASDHYNRSQGGKEGDWTHINDVEVLADGSVMVSPRNMDEVVFIEPGPDGWAVNESRTLGVDDNHDILYEQHNPDYIPPSLGGPAVLVADSENGRIVEYERTTDGWEQSWSWRDVRLQWPRDADRLPDGDTLIVDSHGDRVVEVGPDDGVVWSADVGMPYDVERLGTGDESTGGPAAPYRDVAAEPNVTVQRVLRDADGNATVDADTGGRSLVDQFWLGLKDLVPSLWANGLLYVAPSWVRFTDLAFAAVALATTLAWGGTEFYWSRFSVRGGAERLAAGARRLTRRVR